MPLNAKDVPTITKRVTRSMSSLSKYDDTNPKNDLPQLNSDIKKLTISKASDNHLFSKLIPAPSQNSQAFSPLSTSISSLDSDVPDNSASSSSSNETTIFSSNQVLDISNCPCYDINKNHPINPSWANFAAFHTYLTSAPRSNERLFSFLVDLVSEHLSQAQTVESLNSEIKFLLHRQTYLEKDQSSFQDLKIITQQKEQDIQLLKTEILQNRDNTLFWKNKCSKLESDLIEKNKEIILIQKIYQPSFPEQTIKSANARQSDTAPISNLDPHLITQHHTPHVSPPCYPTNPHQFRPQGRDPSEKLSGADPEKYAIWRYEIDQKFEDDSFLFPNYQKQIAYARAQLCGDLFIHMSNWKLTTPESDQTLDNFFHEIEFFSGAINLDEIARSELLKIKQRPGEKITQFYQRIAVLWTRAKYPEPDRVRSFIHSVHPSLSRNILHMTFSRTENVLEALRTVEINKLGIETHQPRVNNDSSQKLKAFPTNLVKNQNGQPSHRNFIEPKPFKKPCCTKPVGWTGHWYSPVDNPPKLQPGEADSLIQQRRCLRCRGSGHIASDITICPKFSGEKNTKHVNLMDIEMVNDSDDSDNLKD
ncbi:hypothetical protein OnM2_022111 [Erysiphe neolycopersici]|uniref:Retrotransposon gag domain-containing protein n=1 Tax=Erysiphe neolycopersici TaxID=212602 RepID=A0A420I2E3_9PEZI|nr:hypothetical protein OnM2_022111 [Erysiphe neolycopersici]